MALTREQIDLRASVENIIQRGLQNVDSQSNEYWDHLKATAEEVVEYVLKHYPKAVNWQFVEKIDKVSELEARISSLESRSFPTLGPGLNNPPNPFFKEVPGSKNAV